MVSKKIAILVGTARGQNGNGAAVASYVRSRFEAAQLGYETEIIEPVSHFNLPHLTHPLIPVASGEQYDDPAIKAWSEYVKGTAGIILVSPQYNWSIPPSIKLSMDLLFPEWASKPVAVVTYGGHGGSKVSEHYQTVLPGGYKMALVQPMIQLNLPGDKIRGHERMTSEEAIKLYEPKNAELSEAFKALKESITTSQPSL